MSLLYDNSRERIAKALYEAYFDARKGKRATVNEDRFEGLNLMPNIMQLAADIDNRVYEPGRGVSFVITKPIPREIFAAPFRDRVVHHFVCNASMEWLDHRLIRDSYSCRIGKGTLDAIQRLEYHIRSVSDNYRRGAIIAKLDVQGFFMSLNRMALYECMHEKLEQQFPDAKDKEKKEVLDFCWHQIILDDPTVGSKRRGLLSDWDIIPDDKSLYKQPEGQGIVIGNQTSQQLSNVFMDKLDRFVTMELGHKHYGRYVDDFFIVVPKEQRERLLKDIKRIEKFLKEEMGLKLHPKKRYIQEVHKGVPFLGVVIYPYCTVPGRRLVRNFYEAAYKCEVGEKEIESVISYLGYTKQINGQKLCEKVFESVGWDYKF